MATAGTVTVDFDARSARFAAELEKVQSSLKKLEGNTESLAKVFRSLPQVFSAGAIIAYGKAMFEAADAIGDAAARSGIAAESLSRLKFVAEQSDVEFSALTTGIKAFQKNLSEASSGSDTAARSFLSIGLEASKIRSLRLEDQLAAVADGFQQLTNPADKVRVAMDLFGKAGNELVPFLDQGAAGIRRLADEADRLGITLSSETVAGISAADQALKKLKATADGFIQRGLGKLALLFVDAKTLPEVTQITLKLEDLAKQRASIEKWSAGSGSAWSTRLAEINKETEALKEQLRLIELRATLPHAAPGPGHGRPGGSGSLNAQPGVGGTFKPVASADGATTLGPLFSPAQLAEQQTILAEMTTLAREQDFEDMKLWEQAKTQLVQESVFDRLNLQEDAANQEYAMRAMVVDQAAGLFMLLGQHSKAAAIAGILITKARAISETLANTQSAAMLAYASQLIPGDPTSVARAQVAYAHTQALGKLSVGLIAATGALQIAGVAGGGGGGIGGSRGLASTPGVSAASVPDAVAVGANQGHTVEVYINGVVTEKVLDELWRGFEDRFDRGAVIFHTNTQQGIALSRGE